MQQHPVPQEISSYEFRLVGDMTLKQFLQLAGGVGIAFLIFVTPIPGIIKWPIIIFSSLFGVALAFLPIEERPLSNWIFSFFKAIYSPTLYVWKPGSSEEVYASAQVVAVLPTEPKTEEYLKSLPQNTEVSALEEKERSFFQKFQDLVQTGAAGISVLSHPRQAQQMTQPSIQAQTHIAPVSVATPSPIREVQAPVVEAIQVERPVAPSPQPIQTPDTTAVLSSPVTPVFAPPRVTPYQTAAATFALEAAPPNPPSIPNTVVGQVFSNSGGLVDGAILEIREAGGIPKRALRTNKLGHFLSVTPLANGSYELVTEKQGLVFDVVHFETSGEIIPPILIKAK